MRIGPLSLLLVVACDCSDDCADNDCDAGPTVDTSQTDGTDDSVATDAIGPDVNAEDGSREAFCMGRGPVVTVNDGSGGEECIDGIAERLFRFAVCGCEQLDFRGDFSTGSFDSLMDPAMMMSGPPSEPMASCPRQGVSTSAVRPSREECRSDGECCGAEICTAGVCGPLLI